MTNNLGNKETMAKNLRYYMELNNVSSVEMCRVLDVPQSTFSYWLNAKTYPRIDKIEKMAKFFKVEKSDLIEERKPNAPAGKVTDDDIKFALFGGNVSDAAYEEVKRFAAFVKQNEQEKGN